MSEKLTFDDNDLLELLKTFDAHLKASSLSKPGGPKVQTRIYGGFIRNFILGQLSSDINIEVYGVSPLEVWEQLADCFPGKIKIEGTRHQVMLVTLDQGRSISVQVPHGKFLYRPFISGRSDIPPEESWSERDFTANALSACPQTLEIFDYCKALEDLRHRVLRTCSKHRAAVDPDMPLRAIRLAGRLDFQIESETFELLEKNVKTHFPLPESLVKLAVIHFTELLKNPCIKNELLLMQQLGLITIFFPFLKACSEQELTEVLTGAASVYEKFLYGKVEGIAHFITLIALLQIEMSKVRKIAIIPEDAEKTIDAITPQFQLSKYHTKLLRGILDDYLNATLNENRKVICSPDSYRVSKQLLPGVLESSNTSELSPDNNNSEKKHASSPKGKKQKSQAKFEHDDQFFRLGNSLFRPDLERELTPAPSCVVRYDIYSDYTVEVEPIYHRNDLYQYHVQRIELMHAFLQQVVNFMKRRSEPLKTGPLWLHVNDGMPPTRGLPVFCFAQPKGFNNGILFPDWSFIRGYNNELGLDWDNYKDSVIQKFNKNSWEERQSLAFFSGRNTTKKLGTRELLRDEASELFKIVIADDDDYRESATLLESVSSWGNYRYLLDLPGAFPWSVRFKELFLYGAVVIKVDIYDTLRKRSRWINFYNDHFTEDEDYLRFNLEYTGDPTEDKLRAQDLLARIQAKIQEFEKNPELGVQMAQKGQQKVQQITLPSVLEHCAYLLGKYQNTYL